MNETVDPEDLLKNVKERTRTSLETISSEFQRSGFEVINSFLQDPRQVGYEFRAADYADIHSRMVVPIYRGQSDGAWSLQSTAERDPTGGVKGTIIQFSALNRLNHMLLCSEEFRRNVTVVISGPTRTSMIMPYDLEPIAQHYGFRTYCIDWTMDPEVAMFFACTDGSLGNCVPNMKPGTNGTSSLFVNQYHASNQGAGPSVIGAGILQRSLYQKGFVSKSKGYENKIVFSIDEDFCEGIAKQFDYGRVLTDHQPTSDIVTMMHRIRDMKYIPGDIIPVLCRITHMNSSELGRTIDEIGYVVEDWHVIESQVGDLPSVLDDAGYSLIDDCRTIAEQCMDGRSLTVDSAYQFFTSIELMRRLNKTSLDYLCSDCSMDYLVR